MEGKPNEFVAKSLNFTDDIVRGGDCQKRAVFKNGSDLLFVDLDYGGWAGSPVLVD